MKYFLVIVLVMTAMNVMAVVVSDKLLNAIACVESNNNDFAIGDKGNAVGRYQIWKSYVNEVNRICKLKKNNKFFYYKDRKNHKKSKEMVKIYLDFYGRLYERNTKKTATNEVLAKIHNGHTFWKRSNTKKNERYFKNLKVYWKKVNSKLK